MEMRQPQLRLAHSDPYRCVGGAANRATVSSLDAVDQLGRLFFILLAEQVVGKTPEQATNYGGEPE